MAHSSTIRRTLFMHPAHRAIGVTGEGIVGGPYCRLERFSTDAPAAAPIRVALLAVQHDGDACAALALFEQATHRRRDVQCRHVLLDAVDAGRQCVADADCVVVFGQGLHVAQHWSDLDATALNDLAQFREGEAPAEPMQIEPAAAACWHPVLEGVEPFVAHRPAAHRVRLPDDATVLLTARTAIDVQPVAWTWQCPHGWVFSTAIGTAEDFRQSALVRLVLNAVTWLSRVS